MPVENIKWLWSQLFEHPRTRSWLIPAKLGWQSWQCSEASLKRDYQAIKGANGTDQRTKALNSSVMVSFSEKPGVAEYWKQGARGMQNATQGSEGCKRRFISRKAAS